MTCMNWLDCFSQVQLFFLEEMALYFTLLHYTDQKGDPKIAERDSIRYNLLKGVGGHLVV